MSNVVFFVYLPVWMVRCIWRPDFRQGFWQRLGFLPSSLQKWVGDSPVIWVHGASVGEITAAAPLVSLLRAQFASYKVVVTSLTPTGFARAEKLFGDGVFIFPLDTAWAVNRALRTLKPVLFVNMETELWPNFITRAKARGAGVFQVNARLTEESLGMYQRFSAIVGEVLGAIDRIMVQSQEDLERYKSLGVPDDKLEFTGNLKFDIDPPAIKPEEAKRQLGLEAAPFVLVAGSTRPGEEEIILKATGSLIKSGALTLILVPRHPDRAAEVGEIVKKAGFSPRFARKGELDIGPDRVRVVDLLGVLDTYYVASDLAFVGGGLENFGGHNPLEPASSGRPVLFGPFMQNCRAAVRALVREGGGVEVKGAEEFTERVKELLENTDKREEMGRNAAKVVEKNRGVTRRIVDRLGEYLEGHDNKR